jgi:hypothetical protein
MNPRLFRAEVFLPPTREQAVSAKSAAIGMLPARVSSYMAIIPMNAAGDDVRKDGVEAFPGVSVGEVLLRFVREPQKYLLARWNWKSAVLSSLFRAAVFFLANLTAGWPAAIAAMNTELIYRGLTSGFYGALTEGFRDAEPPWAGALAAMVVLPLAGHSMEFVVHWLRGTRNLTPSITASVLFTAVSTLFNLYAMRRGALTVGPGRGSLREDMRRMPKLIIDFVLVLPRQLFANKCTAMAKRENGNQQLLLGRVRKGEL